MTQQELENFIEKLPNVEREENMGYIFYFIGSNHMVPFTTIAYKDNDYDNISQLSRNGVFRVNIGVGKETFNALVGHDTPEVKIDYATLNTFMPHPDYAKQLFICILNPSEQNEERVKKAILEAHALATSRSSTPAP
jgi:hypothetical protein